MHIKLEIMALGVFAWSVYYYVSGRSHQSLKSEQ